MSKKKLNKKGQQAKKNINNAQRIDGEKTIYEVDGKVQVFSENECAEEAHIDGGVVTEETKVVDATNGDVIEVDDDYLEDEDEDEDIDVEEFGDIVEEDRFADEATVDDMDDEDEYANECFIKGINPKILKNAYELYKMTSENPNIVDVDDYGERLISLLHATKDSINHNISNAINKKWSRCKCKGYSDAIIARDIAFSTEFINWESKSYNDIDKIFSALSKQYIDFISANDVALNDPNVKNIYYCNDIGTITSGCLMHTGYGSMPIKGNAANVTIYVPRNKFDEFVSEFTTKVALCQVSTRIPSHLMKLASDNLMPIDGVCAYYLIDMPKFLKVFTDADKNNCTTYCRSSSHGYSILISNYDRVTTNVRNSAPDYEDSMLVGFAKMSLS